MKPQIFSSADKNREKVRMGNYKKFSVAFSYPDEKFFAFFGGLSCEKDKLISDYDRLFRTNEIWLYGAEYVVKSEFQRSNLLSDITAFYRAFGVETDRERPDSLSLELEFMHYLIFKEIHAFGSDEGFEKAGVCFDAQKKFFKEHLYPGADGITKGILSNGASNFYSEVSKELSGFLKSEGKILR